MYFCILRSTRECSANKQSIVSAPLKDLIDFCLFVLDRILFFPDRYAILSPTRYWTQTVSRTCHHWFPVSSLTQEGHGLFLSRWMRPTFTLGEDVKRMVERTSDIVQDLLQRGRKRPLCYFFMGKISNIGRRGQSNVDCHQFVLRGKRVFLLGLAAKKEESLTAGAS